MDCWSIKLERFYYSIFLLAFFSFASEIFRDSIERNKLVNNFFKQIQICTTNNIFTKTKKSPLKNDKTKKNHQRNTHNQNIAMYRRVH